MNTPPNKNDRPKNQFVFHREQDGTINPMLVTQGTALREIPVGVYSLACSKERGFFLKPENDFKLPSRIYGKVNTNIDRFLRSYELNDKNLGVLLIGEPGSGKTLTLKATVQKGLELEIPTLLINEAYHGEELVAFLSTITQPMIVAVDEFDKKYSETTKHGSEVASRKQHTVLQMLDGASETSKKLFVFTANEESCISQYLKDRPSRIRYTLKFTRLELDTVVDYVSNNLNGCTEEHMRAFVHMALSDGNSSNGMNFDTMRELVTEMNQFGGNINDSLVLMRTEGIKTAAYFNVTVYSDGEKVNEALMATDHQGAYLSSDPWKGTIISFAKPLVAESQDGKKAEQPKITLTNKDFQAFGATHDVVEFKKDGLLYICTYINTPSAEKLSKNLNKGNNSSSQIPSRWASMQIGNPMTIALSSHGHSFAAVVEDDAVITPDTDSPN